MGYINDTLGQLLEFQFRAIGFPVVEFTTDLRQDLVVHKFIDRDGAHVEGVGRSPLQIVARIPFINGLNAGPHETWATAPGQGRTGLGPQPLYPFVWRKFFAACADKTSGTLQHPELGPLNVKCEMAHTRWSGNVRQGVFVDVTWVESDDTGVALTEALTTASPVAQLSSATSDLDALTGSVNVAITPSVYQPPDSFTSFMDQIRSTVDQFTIQQKEQYGAIYDITYQANALEDSLDIAANANALNWPLYQAAELAKSSAYDLQTSLLNKGARNIAYYTVTKDSTMAQVAAVLGQQVVDMLMLNPGLCAIPVIPASAVVRYYTLAVAA